MIVGSFNVENMFRRPKVMNQATWADGRPVLEQFAELQSLFELDQYDAAAKTRMLQLLDSLGVKQSDESEWVFLRRSRGSLLSRSGGTVTITAEGRGDWLGWLELKTEAVNETATRNTAHVIADIHADVLVVIEAESRPALCRFNDDVLGKLPLSQFPGKKRWRYQHTMLIDGNDDRGIDVGIYTKDGYTITSMRSHVDDPRTKTTKVFSRDCAEYWITTPGGNTLVVLANHLKSKGYGKPSVNNAIRRAQATRIAEIYHDIVQTTPYVIVAGDFNDTPDSKPLAPLLTDTDLVDYTTSQQVPADPWPGTYGPTGHEKIDYLLCSPALAQLITGGGVHRTGVWHAPNAHKPWPLYKTLTKPAEAASDHAAVWVEVGLA